ncbi:MAG: radical SAM protein [Candidatus Delongbacteria bacterium]|nr:radical SAM protein [Candidatus Delongbacteria bacterium]
MMNDKKNKVYFSTAFDCPLRILDAIKLRYYFTLNNFKVVDSPKNADYYLYITCAATMSIVQKEIETIIELKKSECELIVMGCMPGANQKELNAVFSGKTVSTKHIETIDTYFPDFRIKFNEVPEVHTYDFGNYVFLDINPNASFFQLLFKYGFSHTLLRQMQRHKDYKQFLKKNKHAITSEPCFLKICAGCSNNCTYCNIREAVGELKSKTPATIIDEYEKLLKQGYRIFHFVAEDICSYGLDMHGTLHELLESLSGIDAGYHVKWSLEGVHPGWLVEHQDNIVPFIKSKKIWEITLSVEHGSDRMLELMNRHYKINEVVKTLEVLRKTNPGIKINAMLIEGFPSETDEDYNKTLELLRKIRFDCVTMSAYSEFNKRPSSKIFPKVADEVLQDRLLKTKQLLNKLNTPVIRGDL